MTTLIAAMVGALVVGGILVAIIGLHRAEPAPPKVKRSRRRPADVVELDRMGPRPRWYRRYVRRRCLQEPAKEALRMQDGSCVTTPQEISAAWPRDLAVRPPPRTRKSG